MVRLPRNEKQTYWLNSRAQMWPSVWPWPWPWPRFFKVKYGICYISAKNGPIATKRKANISIELYGSNVTIRFDLGHDLDLEFSRSTHDHDHLVTKVRCMDLPDSDRGYFSCRRAVDTSSLTYLLRFLISATHLSYCHMMSFISGCINQECCTRRRYQEQAQINISHKYCGM